MTFDIDCDAQAQADARARRERIAARCLQGLLAGNYINMNSFHSLPPTEEQKVDWLAQRAVLLADSLMGELDTRKQSERKLCAGCDSVRPVERFAEASPSRPARDRKVYMCRDCAEDATIAELDRKEASSD